MKSFINFLYYRKAYELRPLCPVIAFRCANGFMNLPQKYQQLEFAKKIVTDFMPSCENYGYANTVCASYYCKFGKVSYVISAAVFPLHTVSLHLIRCPQKAKLGLVEKHLEAAKALNVFNAHINFARNCYAKNPLDFNIDELKSILDIFREAPKRKIIFSQIISYFVFVELNPKEACENLQNYLKEGGARNSLEVSTYYLCTRSS